MGKDGPTNRRLMVALGLALGLLFSLGYYAMALLPPGQPLGFYGQLPEATLVERSGREVRLSQLKGYVWVADFIFARCTGPCPLLSLKMTALQEALAELPDVRLVSFTVDPAADTPQVLTAYADRYGAHPSRWLFLTGPVSTLYSLMEKGFLLPVGPPPPPGQPLRPDSLLHSTRLVLVDRQGTVRAYFDSQAPDVLKRVVEGVAALRMEPRG